MTLVHFYSPIPVLRELRQRKALWEDESEMVGININSKKQLKFLHEVFPNFREECKFPRQKTRAPFEFYSDNTLFGPIDAEVAHCMVRHFLPKKVIEIGSGMSTYLLARACLLNKERSGVETVLSVIDPHPNDTVAKGFPGLSCVRHEKAEDVELAFFTQLQAGDILFIDSTHVVRTGGDVNYLFLEVLPRVSDGVIVHIHDIVLPREYHLEGITKFQFFWSEQYLLQAFLIYNYAYEVLWWGSYMHLHCSSELESTFPAYKEGHPWPVSFWMRKKV